VSFWSLVGPVNGLTTKLAATKKTYTRTQKRTIRKTGFSKKHTNTQKHKPTSFSSFRRTARTNGLMMNSHRLAQNGAEITVVRMD